MTATNPNPLANPLNDRPIGNINWHKMNSNGYFKSNPNAELPDSSFSYEDWLEQQNNLHVPNQELPINNLDMRSYGKTWDDKEIYSLKSVQMPNSLTLQELERQKKLKELDAKLSAEMTDEQKQMLNDIEKYLGKSKLIEIDESKKS